MNARPIWYVLAWLVASCVAILICLSWLPIAQLDGQFIPVGHDSIYHAVRVMHAISNDGEILEFDPLMHSPSGSWIPWPWAYDWALSRIAMAGLWLRPGSDPLMWTSVVSPLIGAINIGLLCLIARRLGMGAAATLVSALCLAMIPWFLLLHGAGVLDHHGAEMSFVLAVTAMLASWVESPDSRRAALGCGLALGFALGVHNGLFLLQLPVVAWWAWQWTRRAELPSLRAAGVFASSLLLSTVLILLPASSFREGMFDFAVLSWFHLLPAAMTGAAVVAMAAFRFRLVWIAAGGLLSAVVAALVTTAFPEGLDFLTGRIEGYDQFQETRSLAFLVAQEGWFRVFKLYSGLIAVLPIAWVFFAFDAYRRRSRSRELVTILALAGFLIATQQLRIHYFLLPFMVLVPVAVIETLIRGHLRAIALVSVLATTAATSIFMITAPLPPGLDRTFLFPLPAVWSMRQVCAQASVTVLAHPNAGHLLRLYAGCRTVANNFVLTRLQQTQYARARKLLVSSPDDVLRLAPEVDFVIVENPAFSPSPLPASDDMAVSITTSAFGSSPVPGWSEFARYRGQTSDGAEVDTLVILLRTDRAVEKAPSEPAPRSAAAVRDGQSATAGNQSAAGNEPHD